jgi:hypothetical protein
MTALKTYARMADNVYNVPDLDALTTGLPDCWAIYDCAIDSNSGGTGGMVHSSGFKGCIYRSPDEVVVAFKGTGGGRGFQDVLADAKLAVGVIPREATAANILFEKAQKVFANSSNRPITIIGHSLGGGLAQVISHWYKVRFITFNAPPMGSCIQKAKLNLFKPQQMVRAIQASTKTANTGINYRLQGDVVSSRKTSVMGHYGKVKTIKAPMVSGTTPGTAHKMTVFLDYLDRSSDGVQNPFA